MSQINFSHIYLWKNDRTSNKIVKLSIIPARLLIINSNWKCFSLISCGVSNIQTCSLRKLVLSFCKTLYVTKQKKNYSFNLSLGLLTIPKKPKCISGHCSIECWISILCYGYSNCPLNTLWIKIRRKYLQIKYFFKLKFPEIQIQKY